MKENALDILLLAAMFLGVYFLDYHPHRRRRSKKVKVCYLIVLLLSAAMMAGVTFFPDMPRLIDLMSLIAGKAG